MEKKKNYGLIIGILIVIIVCLVGFIGLLVSGVVSFKVNNSSKATESLESNNSELNADAKVSENSDFVITYKEETEEFKNSNGSVVITNKRNLPVISSNGNKSSADKIVKYLTDVSNKDWNDLKDTSNGYAKDFPDDYKVGVEYKFGTVMNNTMSIVSFSYDMSGSMGGVSWIGNWCYNFDKSSGDVLEFDDVINNSSAKDNLYDYIVKDIENSGNYDSLWDNDVSGYWKDLVKENMFNLGNWLFTDKGITVTFDKYLLGPGATGVISVDIPYGELNNYLKDEYKR